VFVVIFKAVIATPEISVNFRTKLHIF
jgi:hypothetical protein